MHVVFSISVHIHTKHTRMILLDHQRVYLQKERGLNLILVSFPHTEGWTGIRWSATAAGSARSTPCPTSPRRASTAKAPRTTSGDSVAEMGSKFGIGKNESVDPDFWSRL